MYYHSSGHQNSLYGRDCLEASPCYRALLGTWVGMFTGTETPQVEEAACQETRGPIVGFVPNEDGERCEAREGLR